MNFIDIHTHKKKETDCIEILNIFAQDLRDDRELPLCTAGFHPWHIDQHDERETINRLHQYSDHPHILAIGECGLDLAIGNDREKQERIFLKQAGISENKKKPLLIHCVKAHNELIRLQKLVRANMPWVIHAYSAKPATTRMLQNHRFYFSFGESLLKEKRGLIDSLRMIPPEKIFFETDESDVSVAEIYFFAAKILKMDVEMLKKQIFENYKQVFRNG